MDRMTLAQYKAKARTTISEHDLQVSCVRWFRYHYPRHARLLFAIPNGANLGGSSPIARAKNWRKLEAEGAVQGAADLMLAMPSGDLAGLFIEMKTTKGRQSAVQKQFEAEVLWAGYGYAMPRTYEEFTAVIGQYMASGSY